MRMVGALVVMYAPEKTMGKGHGSKRNREGKETKTTA